MHLRFSAALVFLTATIMGFGFTYVYAPNTDSEYFPVKNNQTLVYESSFGDCYANYYDKDGLVVSNNIAEKFKYRQSFLVQDSGIYVKETYQYLKIMLLFTKEATTTYEKPLLRFPLPLSPGMNWKAEGIQIQNERKSKVQVTGRCIAKEKIKTPSGSYDTFKIETIVESHNSRNVVTEWYSKGVGLVKARIVIEGGGLTGTLRDLLGYGTLEFELKELKK